MDSASLEVGHALALAGEVEGSALGAVAVGVGQALRVSKLALHVGVDEVESVTIAAFSMPVELSAVLIGILALALCVCSVSFFTL